MHLTLSPTPIRPEDMQWTVAQLKKFPFTAVQAGVMAGLLGIGGGMVIGPLFMAIGMQPQVPPHPRSTLTRPLLTQLCPHPSPPNYTIAPSPHRPIAPSPHQVGTSSCAFMILWTAVSGVLNYYFSEACSRPCPSALRLTAHVRCAYSPPPSPASELCKAPA